MNAQKAQEFARGQAETVLSRLKRSTGAAGVSEVVALAETMTEQLENALRSVDGAIAGELSGIVDEIRTMRAEVAALSADAHDGQIPEAGQELAEVAKETEAAAGTIMAAAEAILACEAEDPDDYRAEVEAQVMEIFQACAFQDITGQRISKVVVTLSHVEERISALLRAINEGHVLPRAQLRNKDPLLNGPQIGGPQVSQDDIDALFD